MDMDALWSIKMRENMSTGLLWVYFCNSESTTSSLHKVFANTGAQLMLIPASRTHLNTVVFACLSDIC